MCKERVMVPITYGGDRSKKRHATVIGRGTYPSGRRYVDVEFTVIFGKWRERFFEEDVKEVAK